MKKRSGFIYNPRKTALRKKIYPLHLWVGIVLGGFISLVSITGALVVYKPEIERISSPKLTSVKPQPHSVPLDTLYYRVKSLFPKHRVMNIVLYGDENTAISFRTARPKDNVREQIYFNQYTGELLGVDAYDDNFLQWVYDFHANLLMGKKGRVLNAILGFILIFLLFSGMFLLWPGLKKVKYLLRFYRGKSLLKKMYDTHRLVGLFGFSFLILIAFSGSYYGFKQQYHSLFETIASGSAKINSPKIKAEASPYVSIDLILENAKQCLPKGVPTLLFFPRSRENCFSVRMILPSDYGRTGNNHIYLSPYTGDVISTNLWKNKATAEKLTRSMYFIHFGTFGGHLTRILWVFIGFLIPILYFSGFFFWWKKKILRRRYKI